MAIVEMQDYFYDGKVATAKSLAKKIYALNKDKGYKLDYLKAFIDN